MASILLEASRDVAIDLGRPRRVPPVHLADCDQGIIRSALDSPTAGFDGVEAYPELHTKAAVLLYALAKSQACIEGNKRLALIFTLGFLRLNRQELAVGNAEIADKIERVGASDPAERGRWVDELAEWIRAALRRRLP